MDLNLKKSGQPFQILIPSQQKPKKLTMGCSFLKHSIRYQKLKMDKIDTESNRKSMQERSRQLAASHENQMANNSRCWLVVYPISQSMLYASGLDFLQRTFHSRH